ncbi:MAG: hypothetical protein ACYS5V_12100, partial [Planctomycetota bacterium]
MTPALAQISDFWPRVPAPLLVLASAAGLAGWVGLHRLARRLDGVATVRLLHNFRSAALLAGRIVTGFAGVWLALVALGRLLLLKSTWPVWPVALGAVVLTEALIGLYRLERRIVSRRAGSVLTGLRIALAILLALMLLQPVWVSIWTETHRKTVAILVDVSASMQIPDRQLPAYRKLRLAEAFSIRAARRPYRLEDQAQAVRDLAARLQTELDWLNALAADRTVDLRTRLAKRRGRIHRGLTEAIRALDEQLKPVDLVLAEVTDLPAPSRTALRDVKAKLARSAADHLKPAASATDKDQAERLAGRLDRLRGDLRRAVAELRKAAPVLDRASADLDELLYGQLDAKDRAAIDSVAERTRSELAKAVLLHRRAGDDDEPAEALLPRLRDQYVVKVYTFASSPTQTQTGSWEDPMGVGGQAAARATTQARPQRRAFEDAQLQTDLAGALKKALQDAGGEDLAGVVALTDGQDNARGDCEPLVRQIAAQGAVFCAVAFGAERPPADAAIISVQCPDTVFKEDRMYVDAELKLDGLNGRNVKVVLYDGDRTVAARDIRVHADVLRRRVQLADEPKHAGVHAYRLEVKPVLAGAAEAIREVFPD